MAETLAKPPAPKAKKGFFSKDTRPLHRIVGTIILLFTLYFGVTGSLIQLVDIKAVVSHAAATDPEMLAIRESIDGTPNYSVIAAPDYAAPALPGNFDFNASLANVLKGARSSAGDTAVLRYVEFRMLDGKPIGLVQASNLSGGNAGPSGDATGRPADGPNARPNAGPNGRANARPNGGNGGGNGAPSAGNNGGGNGGPNGGANGGNKILRIDPATGNLLPNPVPRPRVRPAQALHNTFKRWHRFQQLGLGDQWEWFNGVIGIGLFLMVITGIILYFRLLRARSRAGLNSFFWSAGGLWRSLHRSIAVVASVFLLVVSISGTLLAMDSTALGIYMNAHQTPGRPGRQFPQGMVGDLSSPLQDAQLPAMLQTTLSSYQSAKSATPIKVLRLRYYNGVPQGLVIGGGDNDANQIVFNTSTGERTSTTEPGYPYTGFPLGWKWHELVKQIHRGDILGISGRFMDLFAGFSLVFLSISGLVMYLDVWKKRRRAGKSSPIWT